MATTDTKNNSTPDDQTNLRTGADDTLLQEFCTTLDDMREIAQIESMSHDERVDALKEMGVDLGKLIRRYEECRSKGGRA